jgi:hypothetical protein
MRRLLVPLFALVLAGSACSTFGTAPAVTIGDREISAKSLANEMKAIRSNDKYRDILEQSYGSPTLGSAGKGSFDSAFVAQVLSYRVWIAAIDRDFDERGVEIDDDVLDAAEGDVRDRFEQLGPGVFDSFPQAYRDQLVRQEAVVNQVDREITEEIGSDPRAFYDANKGEFAEICVSHALAGVQNGETAAEAKAKAQKWYDEIEAGTATFDDVATKESDDAGAAQSGGDLGCGSKLSLQFDPVFETAAFGLKKGVVSEPVQTQFGSHLILVTARSIPSYREVEDQVSTVMQQAHDERINEYVTRVICGADVDVNPRYGTWTSESCDSPAPTLPRITPPEGPAGSTTTLPDLGQG